MPEGTTTELTSALARVARLEATLRTVEDEREQLRSERDKLRDAYRAVQLELELLKKRLFVAKAERVDVEQLELEFAKKLAELDALSKRLEPVPEWMVSPAAAARSDDKRKKPTGRRDLRELALPQERLELFDTTLSAAGHIGFEESLQLVWRKGGFVRLVVARAKYQAQNAAPFSEDGTMSPTTVVTVPMPPQAFPRLLAAPSLLAHVIVEKHCDGMPLHRQQERYLRLGVPLDRSTMCRWLEDVGNTLGATLVAAARQHFLATAFCISTDATGVSVQPLKSHEKRKHQPCRRGHFFVQLADKDFAFFEYVPRETSDAVVDLFKGFTGYVQADAKSVYDVLYPAPNAEASDDDCAEVGCWSHARRWCAFSESSRTRKPGRAWRPSTSRRCATSAPVRCSTPTSPGPSSSTQRWNRSVENAGSRSRCSDRSRALPLDTQPVLVGSPLRGSSGSSPCRGPVHKGFTYSGQ